MDDIWINRPPAPTEFAGIRLGRVQPGRDFEGIVTCEHLVGANTHFAKRRTQPCTGPDCPWCADAIPAHWHGYLSVWSTRHRTQHVLELTALAAVSVADYDDKKGSLRGAMILARRTGNRPNSPVSVTISATDSDLRLLPRGVNVKKFLCTLWSIPFDPETERSKPPAGQNIRNTLLADPPTSPTEPLRFPIHPLIAELHKGNGQAP